MLADWIKAQPKGTGIAMVRHGIHHAYVYGRNPKPIKSLALAARIVRYTNGEVDFWDLLPESEGGGK